MGEKHTPTYPDIHVNFFIRWMNRLFSHFCAMLISLAFKAFPQCFRCFFEVSWRFRWYILSAIIENSEVCPQHPPQCVKHCHKVSGKGLFLDGGVCLAKSGPLAKSNRDEQSPKDPSKPSLCSSPIHPLKQGLEPTGNVYQQKAKSKSKLGQIAASPEETT